MARQQNICRPRLFPIKLITISFVRSALTPGGPNISPEGVPMHLAELKAKSPTDLLSLAESLQIENASSLRKQEMMFAILKNLADNDQAIHGEGTLEILP